MKKINFLKDIKKELKIKQDISESTPISSLSEFDSVGILTFISLADKKYKKTISGDQFSKCKTLKDLISLVKK